MSITGSSADTVGDPCEFASRKVIGVLGVPAGDADTIGFWIATYRASAVDEVRSVEVAAKITRHLHRFRDWFTDGYGHDRITAVTPREVTSWRDHLAATTIRVLAEGRAQTMAPATVNNHIAHLSALFSWTVVHAPAVVLPHGDPTKGVELLALPAPTPRALSDAQVRTPLPKRDQQAGR